MLPKDPFILCSVVNTKLRDNYSSLAELCDDLDESATEIQAALQQIGYTYDEEENQFKR